MCWRWWQKKEPQEPADHALGRSRGGFSTKIHVLCDGEGQPVAWPVALGGDKGYRANWIDQYIMDLGILPVIPSKENEDRDARPCEFDREAYRDRNIVERLIGWLKESRRIFSRFEKTASNYSGMIKMAFIRQFLRYDVGNLF